MYRLPAEEGERERKSKLPYTKSLPKMYTYTNTSNMLIDADHRYRPTPIHSTIITLSVYIGTTTVQSRLKKRWNYILFEKE